MRGFEGGNDALELAEKMESVERLIVGRRNIFRPAAFLEPGMLRPDAGIVEAGRDRMRLGDLAFLVLQEVGAIAVQDAGTAAPRRPASSCERRWAPGARRRPSP